MLKSTTPGRNEGAKGHQMQGQHFESHSPAQLSDLLQQRHRKVQEGPSPAWQLLCDLQGKHIPLLCRDLCRALHPG